MQLMVQYSGGKICFERPECDIMTANFSSDRQHVARIYDELPSGVECTREK